MRVAVLFNSNKLGGAERSLVEQLEVLQSSHEFHCFIPDLKSDDGALTAFLREKNFTHVRRLSYPMFIYQISREGLFRSSVVLFLMPFLFFYLLRWRRIFAPYEVFYLNGSKAMLPVLLWSLVFRKAVTLYWHFRDFPALKVFTLLSKIIQRFGPSKLKLEIIANSRAVASELQECFPDQKIRKLYNLTGSLPERDQVRKIRHIGIAAMFAPWKGIHDVVLTFALFESELRKLGVEKISIFGSEIYQTSGSHQNYSLQIKELCRKLQIEWVQFPGNVPPKKLFAEIDLLIHSSLRPEPFGRVIAEAFKCRVPVISTGLGGAGELVTHELTGVIYSPHDPAGLYASIRLLINNGPLTEQLVNNAHLRLREIEAEIKKDLSSLFPE